MDKTSPTSPALKSKKRLGILLVEDSPDDVDLMFEAVREADLDAHITAVSDGVEALMYLRRKGKYSDVSGPALVLLDLNLPKKDGREVLREMKADRWLRRIPVIVLSTSGAEGDVKYAYENHANCYICKPLDMDDFVRVVQAIKGFWLNMVRLPDSI